MIARHTRQSAAHPRRARDAQVLGLVCTAAVLSALTLPGCHSGRFRDTFPSPSPERADLAREYPDLAKGDAIDVQVFRKNRRIRLTNTTAEPLGPGTLWINQRYSRPIDTIAPGETVEIRLRDFRDEFGEAINAGGFFAFRDPELVVLVEYEPDSDDPDRVLTRLVVVENDIR